MTAWRTTIYRRLTHTSTALVLFAVSFTALMPFFLTQSASAATLAITQVAFTTSERTLGVDKTSQLITIETQNITGTAEALDTPNTSLTVTSNSPTGGQFSLDGNSWGAGAFTMDSGTSNKSFYYRDSVSGVFTLTATVTNTDVPVQAWSNTQNITVRAKPTAGLIVDSSHTYGGATYPAVALDGTCTDPDRPSTPIPCTYTYTFAGQTYTGSGSSVQPSPSVAGLVSGDYAITLIVTDEFGNEGVATPITATVDNTAPVAAVTNNDERYLGGTVQPQVVDDDSSELRTYTYLWTENTDNPESLTFNENTREPIFRPTTAGTYDFILTVCDNLGNCKDIEYSFAWRPVFVTAAAVIVPAEPTPVVPVGLVVTKFNTTDPNALGVTTAGSSAQTSSATAPIDPDPPHQQKTIAATNADNSQDRLWWLLLALTLIAAGYYAYRNWQLGRSTDS